MGSLRAIGGYEVQGELGRGGAGVVVRARHQATGASRAIKLLDGAPSPEAIERFRREAEALARAEGAGVVPIHETGFEQGRFFYVMGMFEGGSLRAHLRRHGRLEWRAASALVARLARTLERCHERGLVHRDLKPENVLLDERGEPWVADFGCARDLGAKRITLTGEILGTLGYMPPEQLEGKAVDARGDVFALGVILHELVSGSLPFEARSPVQQMRAIEGGRPAPVSALAAAPRALDSIIARALAARAGERTASARELALELEAVLEGKDLPSRGGDARRRTLALAAGSGLVLAALVGLALGARPRPGDATASPGPKPAPSPGTEADAAVEGALATIRGSRRAALDWSALTSRLAALGEPGRVALDRVAAAGSLEALELRVRLGAAARTRIRGDDLETLARLAPPEALDELARLALRPGVSGERRLAAVRELARRAPGSADARALLAAELLAEDEESAREEARSALAGRSGPGAAGVLAALLERARDLASAYESFEIYLTGERQSETGPLEAAIGDARKAGLSRAVPGAIRPFVERARLIANKLRIRDTDTFDDLDRAAAPIHRLQDALPPEIRPASLDRLVSVIDLANRTRTFTPAALDAVRREATAAVADDALLEGSRFLFALIRSLGPPSTPDERRALDERTRPQIATVLHALEVRDDGTDARKLTWSRTLRFHVGRFAANLVDRRRLDAGPTERLELCRRIVDLRLAACDSAMSATTDLSGLGSVLYSLKAPLDELGREQDAVVIVALSDELIGTPRTAAARAGLAAAWEHASSDAERRDAAGAAALVELECHQRPAAKDWIEKARRGTPERKPLLAVLDPGVLEARLAEVESGPPR